MSGFLVNVQGASNIVRALQLLNTETNARCRAAVSASLEEAAADARSRVPVDTGELKATIRTEMMTTYPKGWLEVGYGTLKRRSGSTGKRHVKHRQATLANTQPGVYAMIVEFGDAARNGVGLTGIRAAYPADPLSSPSTT